jgi:hypothetical protein
MATSPTTVFSAVHSAPVKGRALVRKDRHRRISPEAGHALEKLGHAIEYLADEYIHRGGTFNRNDAELQAVQMLMAINREIYSACPEVPTLGERLHAWLNVRHP